MAKITILWMRRRTIRAEMRETVLLQGPALPLPSLSLMMMKITPHLRIVVMRKRTNHAEMQGAVLLRGPGASPVEPPGTFVLLGTPEAREREREPEIADKFFEDWRPSMTGRDRYVVGDTPNVPPFPNITFGGPLNQRDGNSNRGTGSPRITERAADVVGTGARDGRLADALGIEDRPSIASPLGRDPSDLETLRSSNEFTPQWGSTARERSASAKRPSPLAIETDRSKARRASPSPLGSTQQDEEMFGSILLMFISTLLLSLVHPVLIPDLAIRPSRIDGSPVGNPRRYARASGAPERIEISTPPALRSHSSGESGDARAKEVFDLHIQEMLERGEVSGSTS